MSRALRSTIVLLSVSAALVASAAATARQPVARAAKTCSHGNGLTYGYTYVTSITVRRTTCTTANKVVKRHGRVSGWHCGKKRLMSSPTQYVDRETCTSGSRRVQWVFSQNT